MTEVPSELPTHRKYHYGPEKPEHIGGPWYWGGWDIYMPKSGVIYCSDDDQHSEAPSD